MLTRIEGQVKHYAWGGLEFLPKLLGRLNADHVPWAEYWLGAHPLGMATTTQGVDLSDYLYAQHLAPLPFLFKVLDVNEMLSIQVHPNQLQAKEGFRREELEGIPIDAFERTFKDDRHKPELMIALSDFLLLQGFMSDTDIIKSLQSVPELVSLVPYAQQGLEQIYSHIINADQGYINSLLKPLGQRIKPAFEQGLLKRDDINYWAAKAFLTHNRKGVCDRGILSLYLMNLVHLKPGEGIFQSPGMLHAYLQGQNIECMASSDNVIRGGLTQKHINGPALLKTVSLQASNPNILLPHHNEDGMISFPDVAREFRLHLFEGDEIRLNTSKLRLVFCLAGAYNLHEKNLRLTLSRGQAALLYGDIVVESHKKGKLCIVSS